MTADGSATRRGGHVLDAALLVIADEGFPALSMRAVAARAGVSLAQVQYYFGSKAELVAAAHAHAGDQFLASVAAVADDEPSLDRLRRILWLWLPIDAEREQRARVWLAYAATAAADAALGRASRATDAELRSWLAEQLRDLRRDGLVRATQEAEVAAGQVLALLDGLVLQCLVLPPAAREALAESVLGTWLDDLAP